MTDMKNMIETMRMRGFPEHIIDDILGTMPEPAPAECSQSEPALEETGYEVTTTTTTET
jgi:hypothetical protein